MHLGEGVRTDDGVEVVLLPQRRVERPVVDAAAENPAFLRDRDDAALRLDHVGEPGGGRVLSAKLKLLVESVEERSADGREKNRGRPQSAESRQATARR